MEIAHNKVADDVVIEIGKFAILWNCFERDYCYNNCYSKSIRRASQNIRIPTENLIKFSDALKERCIWFGQTAEEYVNEGLHPGNSQLSSDADIELMWNFLGNNGLNCVSGCLLIIYRIRNNLMHGIKEPSQLNAQLSLFKAVNGVLENINRKPRGARR